GARADRRAGWSRRDIIRLRSRHDHVAGRNPGEAAIVADIHLAVGTESRAVGPARHLRHDFLAAVGINPRQPLAADLDQYDRAVGQHDRPFRKLEPGCEHANIGHENPPASSWLQADLRIAPAHATTMLPALWQSHPGLPSNHERPQGCVAARLGFDRDPDLETAIAGYGIERLVIALEVRRVGHHVSR